MPRRRRCPLEGWNLSRRGGPRRSLNLIFRLRVGRIVIAGPIACSLSPLDLLGKFDPCARQVQCQGLVLGVLHLNRQAIALVGTPAELLGVRTHSQPCPCPQRNCFAPRTHDLPDGSARQSADLGLRRIGQKRVNSPAASRHHRVSNAGTNVVYRKPYWPKIRQNDYWNSLRTARIRSALSASRIQTSAILNNRALSSIDSTVCAKRAHSAANLSKSCGFSMLPFFPQHERASVRPPNILRSRRSQCNCRFECKRQHECAHTCHRTNS